MNDVLVDEFRQIRQLSVVIGQQCVQRFYVCFEFLLQEIYIATISRAYSLGCPKNKSCYSVRISMGVVGSNPVLSVM